jgi:SpoVK/Ycf46/Vps4 family AAA+-type ATPase
MFQPAQPVLWIATSNNPRRFEANLLDRPGRFDRVFVFPMPGTAEREALFRRYCAWPLDAEAPAALAEDSAGLSGAHIREVCYAAALEIAERPTEFAAELRRQLEEVKGQHAKARSYDFELGERKMGFAG